MSDPARDRLRKALQGFLTEEELSALVKECLSIRKRVSVDCPHCKRMSHQEVGDARAVAQALSSLLETAVGKLGVQNASGGEEIVFIRKVIFPCECDHPCPICTEAKGEHAGYRMVGTGADRHSVDLTVEEMDKLEAGEE